MTKDQKIKSFIKSKFTTAKVRDKADDNGGGLHYIEGSN